MPIPGFHDGSLGAISAQSKAQIGMTLQKVKGSLPVDLQENIVEAGDGIDLVVGVRRTAMGDNFRCARFYGIRLRKPFSEKASVEPSSPISSHKQAKLTAESLKFSATGRYPLRPRPNGTVSDLARDFGRIPCGYGLNETQINSLILGVSGK